MTLCQAHHPPPLADRRGRSGSGRSSIVDECDLSLHLAASQDPGVGESQSAGMGCECAFQNQSYILGGIGFEGIWVFRFGRLFSSRLLPAIPRHLCFLASPFLLPVWMGFEIAGACEQNTCFSALALCPAHPIRADGPHSSQVTLLPPHGALCATKARPFPSSRPVTTLIQTWYFLHTHHTLIMSLFALQRWHK